MSDQSLESIAQALVASGKGILAADESTETIKKRFDSINVESTEENRKAYRELIFSSPKIGDYISGVILFDETIRQSTDDGVPFSKLLIDQGIIPGIKVDMGAKQLESSEEKVTEGLDGLSERLQEYYKLGARFAKWRAIIKIDEQLNLPSDNCISLNAEALASYAIMCQEIGLVPIVEPEVLMDGAHSIEICYEVTKKTLKVVFGELTKQNVRFECILLKPNMVIDGKESGIVSNPKKIAEMTINCFKEVVPESVPGIVFLSGGQTEQQACENLNAMNSMKENLPWELSFSYGRALQASALKAWLGKFENKDVAQQVFLHRAKLTSAARSGEYSPEME